MRIKSVILLAFSIVALGLLSGCDRGQAQMGKREANLLGVAKVERESYGHTGPNTFAVHTDELYKRKNFSGDKVTLLWGLVTLKDY
ncbi:MAG TPA: hypothetical protein VJ952_09210 [Opitutales bacterium]|nr:hypothetical protein [Opitutales bacterium]